MPPQQPQQKQPTWVLAVFGGIVAIIFLLGVVGCFWALITWRDTCGTGAFSFMVNTGSLVFGFVALLFDFFVSKNFSQAGLWLGPGTPLSGGIEAAWTVLRDLMNVALIGALVYAAISMILRINVGNKTPGTVIVGILVAALFVNFSYFFAATIIDGSNFVSLRIYEEGVVGGRTNIEWDGIVGSAGSIGSEAITVSTRVMQITGISGLQLQIADPRFMRALADSDTQVLTFFMMGLMTAFLLGGLTAVFVYMLKLLFGRFISIILLLITSPLAIASFLGIGTLTQWSNQWWKTLWAQTIFPIVFFLFLAIALRIAGAASEGINANYLGIFNPTVWETTGNSWEPILSALFIYALTLGLVAASAVIANSIATEAPPKIPTSKDIYDAYKGVVTGARGAAPSFGKTVKFLTGSNSKWSLFGSETRIGVPAWGRAIGRDFKRTGENYRIIGDNSLWSLLKPKEKREAEKKAKTDEKIRAVEGLSSSIKRYREAPPGSDEETKAREGLQKNITAMLPKHLSEFMKNATEDEKALLGRLAADDAQKKKIDEAIVEGERQKRIGENTKSSTITEAIERLQKARNAEDLREKIRDERGMLLTNKSDEEIIKTLKEIRDIARGKGVSLGAVLPPDMLKDGRVLRELNEEDDAAVAGRNDVSNEEYEKYKKGRQRAQEAKPGQTKPSTPADVAENKDSQQQNT